MNTTKSPLNAQSVARRPGPFGPAWALVPTDQVVLKISEKMSCYDAIDRMIENQFSQLPVNNEEGRIVGVFTWASFSKWMSDNKGIKGSIKPIDEPVREAMEPPRFIDPEKYIDTETDWGNIDYVLVGDENYLLGILCVADVFGRLNDFAEAFVLLYEIEHDIRDLICEVVDGEKLTEMIANMNLPGNTQRPKKLEEFTFNQYKTLICSKRSWPLFEPIFQGKREIVDGLLETVNELRNIVFHFRRGITRKDTDTLQRRRDRFRNYLRYYREQQAQDTSRLQIKMET